MTNEEKQKAINALKISAPVRVMTQEEFNDYIQTINQIMDYLEQETVSKESYDHEYFLRKELEVKIAKLERHFNEIRAEIEHMIPCSKETLSMKLGVLEIIDKYAEEDKE